MSLDVYLIKTCTCGETHTRVYEANITHSLGAMAREAGMYETIWQPEKLGYTKAQQLIPSLESGLNLFRTEPARFKVLDSPNGWGTYRDFLPWVEQYLEACKENPEATIEVSR